MLNNKGICGNIMYKNTYKYQNDLHQGISAKKNIRFNIDISKKSVSLTLSNFDKRI
jgi:hypothetical protein